MTLPLPKWIMYRYSILWNKFNSKEFSYEDALKSLNNDRMTSIALSKLRQNNWLELKLDQNDARKRIYKLKGPEDAIKEISMKATKKDVKKK